MNLKHSDKAGEGRVVEGGDIKRRKEKKGKAKKKLNKNREACSNIIKIHHKRP